MALELLQWKSGVGNPARVVGSVQQLLFALLPLVGSIAVAADEADDGEGEGAGGSAAPEGGDSTPALCGYAAQLCLAAVEALVREALREGGGERGAVVAAVAPALAVRCAQGAPDAAVRNAALSLLSLLGGVMPRDVLDHVLEVWNGVRVGLDCVCGRSRSNRRSRSSSSSRNSSSSDSSSSLHLSDTSVSDVSLLAACTALKDLN
eukprot:133190-Chlamydomonas_euryale.AAC.1